MRILRVILTLYSQFNTSAYDKKIVYNNLAEEIIVSATGVRCIRFMNRLNQEILVPDWLITSHVN